MTRLPYRERKFLIDRVWVKIYKLGPFQWMARYNRMESLEISGLNGKVIGMTLGETFRQLRWILAVDKNPEIEKVTDRVKGKKEVKEEYLWSSNKFPGEMLE